MRGATPLVWLALALAACGDDAGADVDARVESDVGGADVLDGGVDGNDDGSGASDTIDDAAADIDDAFDDSAVAETVVEVGPETTDTIDDAVEGSTEPLDDDLEPCDYPQYWPFSIRSEKVPLRIHYRMPRDEAASREALAILEYSWTREVDEIGFQAPLLDEGRCGEDEALDIFTWRDAPSAYVSVWADNDATPWDDGYSYMVVDLWGEFGGDEMPATLAHEFNHMCQAAHDWSDTAFLYEATATFMEDEVYDDHNSYWYLLFDFQGNPEWSLDHDDAYETWYMYGATLWLRYLRDRFFDGDPSFLAALWLGLRSPWDDNEPDYVDSLEVLLAPFKVSFADTVVEFARWRWYVEERDDGRHLEEAGDFPRDARPAVTATLQATGGTAIVRPMMLGTSYIDIVSTADGPRDVTVSLQTTVAAGDVHWIVQLLPGVVAGSDGELVRLPADVPLTDVGGRIMRTIAVTALPGIDQDIDPDTRTDDRYSTTITVEPK